MKNNENNKDNAKENEINIDKGKEIVNNNDNGNSNEINIDKEKTTKNKNDQVKKIENNNEIKESFKTKQNEEIKDDSEEKVNKLKNIERINIKEENKINEHLNNNKDDNIKEIQEKERQEDISQINSKEEKNEIIPESNYINITEDGGIKKRILKESNGSIPKEGNKVIINYIGKYNEEIFDHSNENEPFSFSMGENNQMKGLEIALKTMKVGEKSEFLMTKEYAFNNNDQQKIENIPPNSILTYEIELKCIVYKNTEESLENLSYEEKLQWGQLLKKEGVEKFKANEISEAKKCFINALTFLKNMDPKKEEEKEGVDLFLTILANICNCYNKEKDFDSIIKFASIGISIKPTQKLLYFRTIAFAYLEEFESSENDLKDLIALFAKNEEQNKQEVNDTVDYLRELIDSRKKLYEEKNKKYSRAIYRQVLYNNKTMNENILVPSIIPNPKNPVVFFEIQIENDKLGKIEFELFKDYVPITSENFRNLCLGTQDGLTYKNSYFNKIIKGFVLGGGNLENNNSENKCIYGEYFDDENYNYCHCRRGLLTMDNDGKNKNNSKFLITLKHIPWFDGKHVVFGQVINGMEIIDQIENIETNSEDRPLKKIVIINCGEIIKKENNNGNIIGNENKIENNNKEKKVEIQNNILIDKNDENKIEENKEDLNQKHVDNLNIKEEIKNHKKMIMENEGMNEECKKENIE